LGKKEGISFSETRDDEIRKGERILGERRREVRHDSVKPLRKGEAMNTGKTRFMGKTASTLQLY
jgi:hypothetical protein